MKSTNQQTSLGGTILYKWRFQSWTNDTWWMMTMYINAHAHDTHTHTHTHITYHTHTHTYIYIYTFRYLHIYYRYNIGNKYVNIQISPYNIYFPYYISIFSSPHFFGNLRCRSHLLGPEGRALGRRLHRRGRAGHGGGDHGAAASAGNQRPRGKNMGKPLQGCKEWGNSMDFKGFLMGF